MYIAMYCMGAVAAVLSVAFRYKQYSPYRVRSILTEIIVVIVAVISGKLLFGLENWIFEGYISFSGIRIYGLIYSVPVMCFLLKTLSGLNWSNTLSLCTPGLAISSAFARIGCQYAGCCGGPPIMIGKTYVDMPEQAMEGVADFLLFLILLFLERKGRGKWLYPLYLGFYAILRFFLDFLRDSVKIYMGLTLAQFISIISILIASIWIMILLIKERREETNHE